jgi:hypothetical protein
MPSDYCICPTQERHNELGTTQLYPINCLDSPSPRRNFCRPRHFFHFSRSHYLILRCASAEVADGICCNWPVRAEMTGADPVCYRVGFLPSNRYYDVISATASATGTNARRRCGDCGPCHLACATLANTWRRTCIRGLWRLCAMLCGCDC